jgi:hypothetical protein
VRTRVSLSLFGVLIIALTAVLGFAAFSAGDTGTTTTAPTTTTAAPTLIPDSVSGRVLGAVVAIALTSEPVATSEGPNTSTTTSTTTTPPEPEPEPAPETADEPQTREVETATAAVVPPDTTPPDLAISSPKDEARLDERVVTFRGTTEPGARVTSGSFEANVDEGGNWTLALVLTEGGNRAFFRATDEAGNDTTDQITVYYVPPETTTTTTTIATPPGVEGGRRNVEEWRPLVEQYFAAELVEDALKVIKCESHGDPLAHNSSSGAAGLFQFIPKTWNWASQSAGWAGASAFDPEANIASAAWLTQWSSNRGSDPWSHWSCKP